MKRGIRIGSVTGVAFSLILILLPQFVMAETQVAVSEIAEFSPAEDNNDEVSNIANETITWNRDTWSPLPTGIFVGGTIQESLMQMRETAAGYWAQMMLTSKVRFDQQYLSSGTSQFYVRLPLDMSVQPAAVTIGILEAPANGYDLNAYSASGWGPDNRLRISLNATDGTDMRAVVWDYVDLSNTNPVGKNYVSNGRLYCRYVAPLHANVEYLLMVWAVYDTGATESKPFNMYWCPSDLCSDNITESRVAYAWQSAPDASVFRKYEVAADLGWSFVFETGLGGLGVTISEYYAAGYALSFIHCVEIDAPAIAGSLNFIWEFKTNMTNTLNYSIKIWYWDTVLSSWVVPISDSYWQNLEADKYVLCSNPNNITYHAESYDGRYWLKFYVSIWMNQPIRLTFAAYDGEAMPRDPLYDGYYTLGGATGGYRISNGGFGVGNKVSITNGDEVLKTYYFMPYCSLSIDWYSLNRTSLVTPGTGGSGFWEGVGEWLSAHWMDVCGAALIAIGGATIILSGGTLAGFGVAIIAAGVGMILYSHWPAFKNFVDRVIQMIIDGLEWLGNWIYKVGMAVWKALTWFVDQVIYYGAIILGLLIILVALFIFVVPIYFEIKILGAFLAMAHGDYEKASAQLAGVISSGRALVGRG